MSVHKRCRLRVFKKSMKMVLVMGCGPERNWQRQRVNYSKTISRRSVVIWVKNPIFFTTFKDIHTKVNNT